ncbi:unnamed protein product [Zymoseptoria tritici ST99CH_1E4]|uniref:Uncharacterized protein n=1 Tax=Zymoseptoria tritici ST99CH_1E4 TaxID=1276532 RepID=A0A2H1H999_ZYMTR|nr:unnamed protein product [Zymoseptoria tritici ST99CH_1E4]
MRNHTATIGLQKVSKGNSKVACNDNHSVFVILENVRTTTGSGLQTIFADYSSEPTSLPHRSRPLEVWPTVLSTSRCQPRTEPQSTQNTDPQSAQDTDPQSSQNTDPQSTKNTDPQSIKNTNPQSSDIKDYKHYRIIAERRSFGVEVYTTGLTDQTGLTTYTARTESTSHHVGSGLSAGLVTDPSQQTLGRGDRQADIVFHDPFHNGGYTGQKRLRRSEEKTTEQGFHQREFSPRNVSEHVGSSELHDNPTADQPANMIAPAKVSDSALGEPNMMSSAESIPPTTVDRIPILKRTLSVMSADFQQKRLPFEKSSQLTERAVSLGSVGTQRQDSPPSEEQGNNLVRLSREPVIPEFTTLSSKSEPMMDDVQIEIAAGHVRTTGSTSDSLAPKPTTSHSSEPEVPTFDDQTIGSNSESAALEQTTLHSSEPEVPTMDDQTTESNSDSTAPEPTTSPLSEHATTINIRSWTKHVLEMSTRSKTLVTCFVTFLVILLFGSILLAVFYSTSTAKHATAHSTYSWPEDSMPLHDGSSIGTAELVQRLRTVMTSHREVLALALVPDGDDSLHRKGISQGVLTRQYQQLRHMDDIVVAMMVMNQGGLVGYLTEEGMRAQLLRLAGPLSMETRSGWKEGGGWAGGGEVVEYVNLCVEEYLKCVSEWVGVGVGGVDVRVPRMIT